MICCSSIITQGTIGMKPKDITARNEASLLRNVYGILRVNRTRKIKFTIGEKVRISKYKHVFEKGYTPNSTTEIFIISEVKNTDPVKYKLVNYQNPPTEGGFYQEELTKVKYPDAYLSEKVLRKGCESGFPYCFLTDFTKFFLYGSTLLDFGFLTEKAS